MGAILKVDIKTIKLNLWIFFGQCLEGHLMFGHPKARCQTGRGSHQASRRS